MAQETQFVERFHSTMKDLDTEALKELIAEEVDFGPPSFWSRSKGRDVVMNILSDVFSTIEEFTYHRHFTNHPEYAFEFTGTVGGKNIQGIDLFTLNEEGRIAKIDVMIRPYNGLGMLMEKLQEKHAKWTSS